MTDEIKTTKPPRTKRVLGLQPKDPRHYILSFTVIMGQGPDFTSSPPKFTRAASVHYTTNLTGEDFVNDARSYATAYALVAFVLPHLEGKIKVLSLYNLHYQEAPC